MAWIILLIFIGGPLLELSVLIDVGGEIGAVPTVLLCVLTAAIGLSLVRLQGLKVLRNMQEATQRGDAFGALLLIPMVRLFLGKAGLAHVVVRSNMRANWGKHTSHHHDNSSIGGVTIDGEYHKEESQTEPTVNDDLSVKNPYSGDTPEEK